MGRVLDFLFPIECIACGAPRFHCCGACLGAVVMTPKVFASPEIRAISPFAYGQPIVRRLIHDLKYQGWTVAAGPLSVLTRRAAVKLGAGLADSRTIVAPVPLSKTKMRVRGFNQAETIATALAVSFEARLMNGILERRRDTAPQTDARDRGRNVAGAFAARLPKRLFGAYVLLVDDVWTSGSTMRECAKALYAAGAGNVKGFALAWGKGLPKEASGT
jgi:ComF family protein